VLHHISPAAAEAGAQSILDVLAVNVAAARIVAVEPRAAGARHHANRCQGSHPFAARPHPIFPRCPVALFPPFLEIGLGQVRQDIAPSRFEARACLFEIGRGAAPAPTRFHAGIEAAAPFPLIDLDGTTGAARDRAYTYVAVVDVPAILALSGGEGRAFLIEARWRERGKPLVQAAEAMARTQRKSPGFAPGAWRLNWR